MNRARIDWLLGGQVCFSVRTETFPQKVENKYDQGRQLQQQQQQQP